jgi:4-amino-4-deoxy-L-arabinose transferase-like glycosyltransferase
VRGALAGAWPSLDRYAIADAYQAGRAVSALIGTGTVWLTYRLGKEVRSPALGLLAAAQLALYEMHVRESHFVLTDAPATALATLTLLLTVRAARLGSIGAYALASAAAGLAAAAKYNAVVVFVVVPLSWLICERRAADRWRKALVIAALAPLAFLVAVPYALLDIPAFLTGFGAQMGRFSARALATGRDAPWRVYLGHLSLASPIWLPLAAAGLVLVVWRRQAPVRWTIPIAFAAAYYGVLSTHGIVFGRYALLLLPPLCLLAAVPILELGAAVGTHWPVRYAHIALATAVAVVLLPLLAG